MNEITFNDFIKLNRGFDLPNDRMIEGEFPVIASTTVKGYHNEYKVNPPCVVTGRSGSLGKVQYTNNKCWPLNTTLYVKDYKGNYPKYVYYYLQIMHLENYDSGAGVPTLNQNHLHRIKVKIHDFPSQKKIADTLFAYESLIENNNHRIELLEKTAQEIYKEWFIRMRFPNYENVHHESGIPQGWDVKRLKDICDIDPKVSLKKNEEYAFIDIAQINPSQGIALESEKSIFDGQSCSKFSNGDTLMSRITPCLENRKIAMAVLLSGNGFGSTEFFVFRGKPSLGNNNYVHQLVSSDQIVLPAINSMTGASGRQRADKKFIGNIKIIYPTKDLIALYEEISDNINKEVIILIKKNRILMQQRDLLLPRLMSGKLEVK